MREAKEVLEYTREELESLSYNDLNILLKEAEFGESLWNTKQMTLKIQINSFKKQGEYKRIKLSGTSKFENFKYDNQHRSLS